MLTYLTNDQGISKEVIEPGNGVKPLAKDCVKVHYEGFLLDTGNKFDSSYERHTPFEFILGEGKVISGWEIAVKTMQVGETSKVICSSQYAYGQRGRLSTIPPNATLVFIIKLLSTEESPDSPAYLTKMATDLKGQGNDYYKNGDINNAIATYKQAKEYTTKLNLNDDGISKEEQDHMQSLTVSIFANIGACYFKLQDWKNTINICKEVLKLDPYNVKSYYRIGQSYSEINDIEEAMHYVKQGLDKLPNDQSLIILYKQLEKKYIVWKNRNKEKYSKLFA
ncbi:hypothetical protein BC941DRAFT_365431, partial [Chlamydoabsidia padenii]